LIDYVVEIVPRLLCEINRLSSFVILTFQVVVWETGEGRNATEDGAVVSMALSLRRALFHLHHRWTEKTQVTSTSCSNQRGSESGTRVQAAAE